MLTVIYNVESIFIIDHISLSPAVDSMFCRADY